MKITLIFSELHPKIVLTSLDEVQQPKDVLSWDVGEHRALNGHASTMLFPFRKPSIITSSQPDCRKEIIAGIRRPPPKPTGELMQWQGLILLLRTALIGVIKHDPSPPSLTFCYVVVCQIIRNENCHFFSFFSITSLQLQYQKVSYTLYVFHDDSDF